MKQLRADADHNKVVGDEDEPEKLDLVVVTGSSGSDGSGAGVWYYFDFLAVFFDNVDASERAAYCAALRDNILDQTCKSMKNPRSRVACIAAAWATYFACLAG